MAWDDEAPKENELSWDSEAPTKEDLAESKFDKLISSTNNEGNIIGDIAKKAAQGASMGFLPRIAGALEAGGQAIGVKGLGGKDLTDIELQAPNADIVKNYEEAKKTYENELENISQRRPITSALAEVGGAITSLNPASGASLGMRALQGAGLGAVSGYGYSKDDESKLKNMATGAALGGVLTPIADLAGRGVQKVSDAIGDWSNTLKAPLKENADDILRASQELGFEPSKAMLTDSNEIKAIEESLAKNTSMASSGVRKNKQQMFDAIKNNLDEINKLNTGSSVIEEGENVLKTMAKNLEEKQMPVSEMYKSINQGLSEIPISKNQIDDSFNKLLSKDLFKSDQGRAFANTIKKEVGELSDLSSLNNYIQDLYKQKSPMMSMREQSFIDSAYDALKNIRNGSMEELKSMAPSNSSIGESIDKFMETLKGAEKLHAQNISDISELGNLFGTRGKDLSPKQMMRSIDELGSEQAGKLSRSASAESLMASKEKFPEVFEKARQSRLNQFLSDAETKGELDFNKLARNYSKLSKELQSIIFDDKTKAILDNLSTVYNATPGVVNPSGTSQMMRIRDMFSPEQNVSDYLRSKTLDWANPSGNKFIEGISNFTGKLPSAIKSVPSMLRPFVNQNDNTQDELKNNRESMPSSSIDPESIMQKVKGSKFEQALLNAKQKGDNSFNAAYYVLANRDQEFRKQLGGENGA